MEAADQKKMLELMAKYRAEEARESWLNRETRRHHDNIALFEAMIRMAYPDATAIVAGHHIMVMRQGHPHPMEIASADTLIFDHDIAKAVWGQNWQHMLRLLASTPVDLRDDQVRATFNSVHGTTL